MRALGNSTLSSHQFNLAALFCLQPGAISVAPKQFLISAQSPSLVTSFPSCGCCCPLFGFMGPVGPGQKVILSLSLNSWFSSQCFLLSHLHTWGELTPLFAKQLCFSWMRKPNGCTNLLPAPHQVDTLGTAHAAQLLQMVPADGSQRRSGEIPSPRSQSLFFTHLPWVLQMLLDFNYKLCQAKVRGAGMIAVEEQDILCSGIFTEAAG